MGTLTEIFEYLRVEPEKLTDFKEKIGHMSISEERKNLRKELKLWQTEEYLERKNKNNNYDNI